MKRSVFVLALLTTACGVTGRSRAVDEEPTSRRSSDVITREEIAASGLSHMEEVIQRLRPQFLRSRGRSSIMRESSEQVAVYLDGVLIGTTTALRNLDAAVVERVEWVGGSDTGIRVGRNHSAGAIVIATRRGTPGAA